MERKHGKSQETIAPITKEVKDLTTEDMQQMAKVSGGKFLDTSKIHGFSRGEVLLPKQEQDSALSIAIEVRTLFGDAKITKDNLVLVLSNVSCDDDRFVFPGSAKLTMDNMSIILEDSDGKGNQKTLEIKENNFKLNFSAKLASEPRKK
jgi:hypothetical protein